MKKRKFKGEEIESPSTTGMEKENGDRSIQVEYSQDMEKFMNEEFDKLSRNKNVELQPAGMEDNFRKEGDKK